MSAVNDVAELLRPLEVPRSGPIQKRCDDSHAICTIQHHLESVVAADAADGDQRRRVGQCGEEVLDAAQMLSTLRRVGLGGGGRDAPACDVVGAHLRCAGREDPALIAVGRDTEEFPWAEQAARGGRVQVPGAHVQAVGPGGEADVQAVVHKYRDTPRPRDLEHPPRSLHVVGGPRLLQAHLHAAHAPVDEGPHPLRQVPGQVLVVRHQVQAVVDGGAGGAGVPRASLEQSPGVALGMLESTAARAVEATEAQLAQHPVPERQLGRAGQR
mmetsp:Transcript_79309/g.224505  ORF Transcript_79309/g.224505 Transcript_79309/m.224505 type:complete len:270 (-) Transcript_79309:42-851(-)